MFAPAFPDLPSPGATIAVHQGDCVVSRDPTTVLSTVLGSCIAACVWDSQARLGGMNHFLLAAPGHNAADRWGASARYGAFAMEQLLNTVLAQGSGRKANLVLKLFGGARITAALTDVGAGNIAFVQRFMAQEGYQPAAQDLGGTSARRVLFAPASGRAFVKRLDLGDGASIARAELDFASRQARGPAGGDVDLF